MPVLNTADALYVGSDTVDAVYLGSSLVWEPAAPPSGAVFAEDFNKSDGNTLGPLLTWTSIGSTWATSSNVASNVSTGGNRHARAEHDTDTSDQYVEADIVTAAATAQARICGRFSASATTFYCAEYNGTGGTVGLARFVSGTRTAIGSAAAGGSLPGRLRLEIEGTALRAYWNGSLIVSATNSNIASGTRGGISCLAAGSATAQFDNFEYGDL